MAAPRSPYQPAYLSPRLGRHHSRRGSARESFSSSLIDSPRTPCPPDGDAFSFDPSHLPDWYISQHLWDCLAPKVQASLRAMQHSGAAVLTGFERVKELAGDCKFGHPNHVLDRDTISRLTALPSPKLRTTSIASSVPFSDIPSPTFTDTLHSGSTTPSESSSLLASPVAPAISPMCLTPSDGLCLEKDAHSFSSDDSFRNKDEHSLPSYDSFGKKCERPSFDNYFEKHERSRERSFSTPREPHEAKYALELSHLRTEAVPRLRHAARKVELEWKDAQRLDPLSPNDTKDFEDWLAKMKSNIDHHYEVSKRMSAEIGISSSGMGWTYAP